MLTLHAGMPKTGTTSLQARLADNSAYLHERGIVYPADWRDQGDIGHHKFGERLNQGGDAAAAVIDELRAYLSTEERDVLLSTESLTNLLNKKRQSILFDLIASVSEIRPVRLVIALRAIDSFFESMFLHTVKYEPDCVADIRQYLSLRTRWSYQFFKSLAAVRAILPVGEAIFVPYSKTPIFESSLSAALNLDENLPALNRDGKALYENRRLSLKGQSLCANLDETAALIGRPIDRERLSKALYLGELAFENDTEFFHVTPFETAKSIHDDALDQTREFGIPEYYDAFHDRQIPAYDHHDLTLARIDEADQDAIQKWCQISPVNVGDAQIPTLG